MNGRGAFPFATRVMVSSAEAVLAECGRTVDEIGRLRPPPGQHPHHRPCHQEAGHSRGKGRDQRFIASETPRRARFRWLWGMPSRRRTTGNLETSADIVNGRRAHMGLGADRVDTRDERSLVRIKIAFMLPGQGSFEPGMGRDIVVGRGRCDGVFDAGSKAFGPDLRRICFAGTHMSWDGDRKRSSRRSSRRAP